MSSCVSLGGLARETLGMGGLCRTGEEALGDGGVF